MEKSYQPKNIEQRWTQFWEQQKLYKPSGKGQPYCIMLPPPNVTGTLHMGHGFQLSLMDALIRRQRMLGKNVLWQPGTDHASIATQMVVERQLAQENLTRHDLGRAKFVKRVDQWSEQSGSVITQQIRRMGASLDWEREHYSMDPVITQATYAAFIQLFEEGLIYRGKRMVNWDPHLHTALSDLEVTSETIAGHLWYLRYPLTDGSKYLTVATTRPETLLGDVAVAVNPQDSRYQALIGRTIKLPLVEREIPIIADDSIDIEFGTGCVKITPAHDFNDYAIAKRHHLPIINILNFSADCNQNTPPRYRGIGRFAARKQVIEELAGLGLLEKIEPYNVTLPRGDRSGVILEPMLTDQWFVKMQDMADSALSAIEKNQPHFVPENWEKTYRQWLTNIEDWCISRQLWWGHRIPIWYDSENRPYAGYDELDVRKRYALGPEIALSQDEDVLDTWFTAALWPFSSLHWPEKTADLMAFYPTNVLVTGFDIIFFWVARMVMMGLKIQRAIPFREVYIHGLIRDSHGHKMSKSKGNILDPIDLMDGIDLPNLIAKRTTGLMQPQMAPAIEKNTRAEFPEGIGAYGADALRFTFCALATTGRDINFDMNRIGGYRNFCNKLWNAARFVLMNNEGLEFKTQQSYSHTLADRWIKSLLQKITEQVNQAFEEYRFDLIAATLYEFTWNEYCDWYLELAKCILVDPLMSEEFKNGARQTLLVVLDALLRLLHPLIPFITEEIWQVVVGKIEANPPISIMIAAYPQVDRSKMDLAATETIDWLKQVINGIRNVRGEMKVPPGKNIRILLNQGSREDHNLIKQCENYIKTLAKVSTITWLNRSEKAPAANAMVVVGHLEIYIPLADLVDKNAELNRLTKEIEKLHKDRDKLAARLANTQYLQKASAEVVAKEKSNLEQINETLAKLQENRDKLALL
ncbi:MAG: valine--tRNA ligase [Proteobacteria bacterium]|nr:valine--tRNA ligase [Pseudomonadota bacterium]